MVFNIFQSSANGEFTASFDWNNFCMNKGLEIAEKIKSPFFCCLIYLKLVIYTIAQIY